MFEFSPLAYIVIAVLVVTTAQKTIEYISNELQVTNYIPRGSIRLMNGTFRSPKVNLQIIWLFIYLLKILLSIWIMYATMVDKDGKTRPGPISKNQNRRFKEEKQEFRRKPYCDLVSSITSMTSRYTDGNDMVDVTTDKDHMIHDRNSRKRKLHVFADNFSIVWKKKCFIGSECDFNGDYKFIEHQGKTTNFMQYSFLYANFHQTSINVGSFAAYPTTPMREDEDIRLENTRAMVDGNANSVGHNNADDPPVDLDIHRRHIRVRSGIRESLSSLIASRTRSGFNSLTVYDNGSLVTSNNRTDLPLATGLSYGQPNYQSSGYESFRHSRHVRSGQFSFSLELQADMENNEQHINHSNLSGSVFDIDPSHSSGLPAGSSYSGGVSCFEGINEVENEHSSVDNNNQIYSRCPESTRPVHRTAHFNGFATGIIHQPHRDVLTVSLRDSTERKETESSTSHLAGNLSPFDMVTRSQSSCPAHDNVQNVQDRPAQHQEEVRSSFGNITHTGYTENANEFATNVPRASAPNVNENSGNMDQMVSSKTQQVFSTGTTGQQFHSSSCGNNEHAHRNGNQFGSYNRLQSELPVQQETVRGVTGEQQTLNHVDQQTSMENNQDEATDDVLFGEGQPQIPNFDLINEDEEEEDEEDRNLCTEVEENTAEI
ncbi:unnamed protein product [Mytilus coruscus]|uniref:Uncharacterized protein n=1 Tax=Mytilus coruscus TaxID=42192 RepID=A0A6J8BKK0_MYTCO|nr:unnamed protein product [Mytilus coruscus]